MTPDAFRDTYDDWGVATRVEAEAEALVARVRDARVVVVGFPLGDGVEWTLRLDDDLRYLASDVIVLEVV
jgi:hypothetical protein